MQLTIRICYPATYLFLLFGNLMWITDIVKIVRRNEFARITPRRNSASVTYPTQRQGQNGHPQG